MRKPKLHAYLITYTYCEYAKDFMEGKGQIKSITIVARFESEAESIFNQHYVQNLKYDAKNLQIISIQQLNKTKKNAHFFANEFYEKQLFLINNYEDFKENGLTNFYRKDEQ